MKKATQSVIDLGAIQANLEQATRTLKAAQRTKLKADQDFERAAEAHERARVSLNAAVNTLKSASTVANMYAA